MDWASQETWKSVADFMSDWKTIATSIVAVGGAAATLLGWFARPIRRLASKFRRAKPTAATSIAPAVDRPLRFVPDDHGTYWSIGTFVKENEQAMSLWGRFNVTNVSDRNVVLLKFRLLGFDTEHHMLFGKTAGVNGVPIQRKSMRQVDTHCLLRRSIDELRKPFIADVIFIDNFGDEHAVRSVRFEHRGP